MCRHHIFWFPGADSLVDFINTFDSYMTKKGSRYVLVTESRSDTNVVFK